MVKWLFAGASFGVVDSALTLRSRVTVAGDSFDRAMTVLLGAGVNAVGLAVFATFVGGLLRLLIGSTVKARRWGNAVTWAGWIGLTGALNIEDLEAHAELPVSPLVAAGITLGVAVLVAIVAAVATKADGSRTRPWHWLMLLGAGCAVVLLGWTRPSEERGGRQNLILISLDTLRADHLDIYGYGRETAPNLSALASRGTVFENAQAPSNWTLPSHASMLTGLDPAALGVLDSNDLLAEGYHTAAERLEEVGYRTAAFVGNGPFSYIGAERGFGQGFEDYFHSHHPWRWWLATLPRTISKAYWKLVNHNTETATSELAQASKWLWRHQDVPFFLFVHLYDIHSDSHQLPYQAPEPFQEMFDPDYTGSFTGCGPNGSCASQLLRDYVSGRVPGPPPTEDIQRMEALYDGGIAYTDNEVGLLLDRLTELGIESNTAIVVTSDHGEAFFEHGVPLHTDLHHENLHVPLVVVDPSAPSAGIRVSDPVEVRRVAPTLLDLSGAGLDEEFVGESLLRAEGAGETAFSVSKSYVALRDGDLKAIVSWGSSLESLGSIDGASVFDVQADGLESTDLFDPAVHQVLVDQLIDRARRSIAIRGSVIGGDEAGSVEMSEAVRDELKALGYVDN